MSAASSEAPALGRATYCDGRTAERHGVRAAIEGDALVIADECGASLAAWPIAELKLIDRPRHGEETRFTRLPGRRERLTLHDQDIADAVLRRRPDLARSGRPVGRGGVLFALGAALVAASAVAGLPYASPLLARLVPAALERRIGDAILADYIAAEARRLKRPALVCARPKGTAAFRRLLDELRKASGHTDAVRLVVVDTDVENAYALPGGTIIVLRGLLDPMRSADELSGVMAHELAHVRLDHAGQQMVETIGLDALISFAFGGGAVGRVGDFGGRLIELAYSRGQEAEADRGALATLQAAGLRTSGAAALFQRWEAQDRVPSFHRSHPAPAERKALFAAAGSGGAPAMTREEWFSVRRVCFDVRPMPDPR